MTRGEYSEDLFSYICRLTGFATLALRETPMTINPFVQGQNAFSDEKSRKANPYRQSDPRAQRWTDGYDAALRSYTETCKRVA